MKNRFLMTMTLVAILLVAVFGATGAYGATTEDVLRVDGIDVSQWNGDVDWHKAKANGKDFVFLRIGGRGYGEKGVMYFDDNLKVYFDGAKEADLMVGGYFFSQAVTVEEAIEEAEYVHNKILEWGIDPSGFDLPIFVDREFQGSSTYVGRLAAAKLTVEEEVEIELAFCDKLRELGYESGLYSYLSFLSDNTDSTVVSAKGYPIWVAQYNSICQYDKQFEFWQYTDKGVVEGLPSTTDLDYWYLNKDLSANSNSNFLLDKCSIEIKHIPLYSSEAIIPSFEIKDKDKTLVENIDYKIISYIDNIDYGTGYAIIRGLNSYTGYRAVPFKIISKLDAPQNVKVATVASSGKPKVTWDEVEGASKYEVYRAVGPNGTYEKYYTTTGTSMTNTSATPGTIYYYKVKAIYDFNNLGDSPFSDRVYIACDLPQPNNVKVAPVIETGKPKVTWDKVSGASKYEVWRAVGPNGTYEKFFTTTGTSMINTSTTPGTIYYYKVKAICGSNSGGNSAFSDRVYMACDLPQPKNVKVAPVIETGKPKVTWDKVSGASKYEVWRAVGPNGTYEKFFTTTGTSMINTSTTPGTIYYYKVKAICGSNSGGNSAFSNRVYMACDLAQPTASITLTSSCKPKVSWKAVNGATKYEVYRAVGPDGTYEKYYTTTSLSMTNTSAQKGTTYYYKVKAICGSNSGGNSALSNKVYITSK